MPDYIRTFEDPTLCNLCRSKPIFNSKNYPPVWFFGEPEDKKVYVVGLNPSLREFESNPPYIPKDASGEEYLKHLRNYFKNEKYKWFFGKLEAFFGPVSQEDTQGKEIRLRLGWRESCWEAVGFLDLVKCPFDKGWGKTKQDFGNKTFDDIVLNCLKSHLVKQLEVLNPRILVLYGADVERYLGSHLRSMGYIIEKPESNVYFPVLGDNSKKWRGFCSLSEPNTGKVPFEGRDCCSEGSAD
ncbi:MAG: uracil-DNA glycosylase family protein [Candidatus Methanosuratincola petrocarbonis]